MKRSALDQARIAIAHNSEWADYLDEKLSLPPPAVSAHLAVFIEPYLSSVFDGTKTIESRFSLNRCEPFGSVAKGDIVLIKEVAGPIVGLCRVAMVWSYLLDPDTLAEVRSRFEAAMRVNNETFWAERMDAAYATFLQISHVTRIQPFNVDKKDRRGRVVLKHRTRQLMLWDV